MDKTTLNRYLNEDWIDVLQNFVLTERLDHIFNVLRQDKHVLPDANMCFRAFNCCNWKRLKVIILGQDCYVQEGVANGLCFSTSKEGYMPPSLRNILKEIHISLGIERRNTDLYDWAEQGCLMVNAALTVRRGDPGSHLKIWAPFTEFVLSTINEKKKGLIVMLWGSKAKAYKHLLSNQTILEAGHPSPLNTTDLFVGCNHFKTCNQLLKERKLKPINW